MTKQQEIKKVPQLSVKTAGYKAKDLRKLVDGKKEQVTIATVGGVAISQYSGVSVHGEWTGFKGSFFMMTRDGEQFMSEAILLPKNAMTLIKDQLDKGVIEVEFKFEISVAETEKNASGYAYFCEPIKTPEMVARANSIAAMVFGAGRNLLTNSNAESENNAA